MDDLVYYLKDDCCRYQRCGFLFNHKALKNEIGCILIKGMTGKHWRIDVT
jgi:hypothetical protein